MIARKGMTVVLVVLSIQQLYFLRELPAAELFFALGFAVLFVFGGLAYVVGLAGEYGLICARNFMARLMEKQDCLVHRSLQGH